MVGSYLYLKSRPAFVQRDQGLTQYLAGSGGGNAGGVQRGSQLVQVCTDDVGLGHSADGIQQLQKAYAAGLRGTGTREAGGVKAVQVNGQVHRHLALAQLCGQLGKAGKIKLVHLGVLGSKLELCPVSAADAELMDAAIPYQLVAAAQHAGVAELCAQIVVPQVGVGIEVHDMQIRVFLHRSPHRAQRDQMLAAQQQRELAVFQNFLCPGPDVCQGQLAGAKAQLQVAAVKHVKVRQVGVLVQSNFGATEDFVLNGEAVGPKILEWKQEKSDMAASEEDKGSIMSILATDLPVTSRQLKRILKRTGVGIARTGGYTGHGSGEVMIGFTTANRIPSGYEEELVQISAIPENIIDRAFLAAAEAEQEAILNSMTAAEQIRGIAGELYYSLAEYLEDRES